MSVWDDIGGAMSDLFHSPSGWFGDKKSGGGSAPPSPEVSAAIAAGQALPFASDIGAGLKTGIATLKTAGGFEAYTDDEFYFGVWCSLLLTAAVFESTPGTVALTKAAAEVGKSVISAAGEAVPT